MHAAVDHVITDLKISYEATFSRTVAKRAAYSGLMSGSDPHVGGGAGRQRGRSHAPRTGPNMLRPTTAAGDGGFQPGHREAALHPGVDVIAHDAAVVHVLDGAQIQLAVAGRVLGDARQPQPVGPSPVKFRRTRSSWIGGRALAFFPRPLRLPEGTPPPVVPAEPPGGQLGHRLTSGAGLVEKEAVPELGIVTVRVEQGVGPVCLRKLAGRASHR
ncbi:hypothetical protein ACF1AU_31770 [Streptomyces rubrogriseus]|uniref:hypothetical protein n=1 Tax=Streptomyces rubrogriseus TaxID=194673 RepID=UPI0036FED747